MRIVDVCAFYSPRGGGVKTYVEQKLAIGPSLGHDITIIAPGDAHATVEHGHAARVVTIPAPRFPLDRKYWYFDDERALHAALNRAEPDFVEVSSPWRSPSMVARWHGQAGRSLIMHADPLSAYAYRWFQPLLSRATIDRRFATYWTHLRALSTQFDRIVCANNDLRSRLRDGGVANTITHPMGVEGGMFSPARRSAQLRRQLLGQCGLTEDAHLLIGVGRLAPEKRWPMVVDAVIAASHQMPIGLIILGEGSQLGRIARQIAGNPHIAVLRPERDRARFATILASADALIHGCEAETFCMAAAEARASGVPVIVPDSGGAADHAKAGGGRCYRSGSAMAAADAILRQLQSASIETETRLSFTMRDHFSALFDDYQALLRDHAHAA